MITTVLVISGAVTGKWWGRKLTPTTSVLTSIKHVCLILVVTKVVLIPMCTLILRFHILTRWVRVH